MLYLGLERRPHQQVLILRARLELRVLRDVDAGAEVPEARLGSVPRVDVVVGDLPRREEILTG
jgi:hypothetical protein